MQWCREGSNGENATKGTNGKKSFELLGKKPLGGGKENAGERELKGITRKGGGCLQSLKK